MTTCTRSASPARALLLALLVAVAVRCSSGRPRAVQPLARSMSARVGDTVRFECVVEPDEADATRQLLYSWYWQRSGAREAERQSISRLIDDRLRNPSSRVLTLQNVEASDAGEFSCVASSGSGQADRISYTLSVFDPNAEPPAPLRPPTQSQPPAAGVGAVPAATPCWLRWREQTVGANPLQAVQDQVVLVEMRAGEETLLSCQAQGEPEPHIRWLHNGQHQARFDGVWVLRLSAAASSPDGLWRCEVASSCRSLAMAFRVEMKAEITMSQPLDQQVDVGSQAAFECVVRSQHRPNIFWLRLLQQSDTRAPSLPATISLPDDNKQYLLLKGDIEERVPAAAPEARARAFATTYDLNEMEYVSHLRIERARPADAGRYMCVANLHNGYAAYVSKSAELIVRPDPNQPPTPAAAVTPASTSTDSGVGAVVRAIGAAAGAEAAAAAGASPSPAGGSSGPEWAGRHLLPFYFLVPLLALLAVAAALSAYCVKQRRYQKVESARLHRQRMSSVLAAANNVPGSGNGSACALGGGGIANGGGRRAERESCRFLNTPSATVLLGTASSAPTAGNGGNGSNTSASGNGASTDATGSLLPPGSASCAGPPAQGSSRSAPVFYAQPLHNKSAFHSGHRLGVGSSAHYSLMDAGDQKAFYVAAGGAKFGHGAVSGSGCTQGLGGGDVADTSLGSSGAGAGGGQVLTLYGVPESAASSNLCSEQSLARPTEPAPTPVPMPVMSLPGGVSAQAAAAAGGYYQHYFSMPMPAAPAVYYAAQTGQRHPSAHAFGLSGGSPHKSPVPMQMSAAAMGASNSHAAPQLINMPVTVTQLYAAHSYSSGSDPYSSIVSASQTSPSARLM